MKFYEDIVLHSLGIAKIMEFADGTKVLDIGTGGFRNSFGDFISECRIYFGRFYWQKNYGSECSC